MRGLALLLCLLPTAALAAENPWITEGRQAVEAARALRPDRSRARNVILFLGDGMSLTTVTAARILEGQQRGESGEENRLAFEYLPYVSLVKTYNTNQQTPDSAGTMTAIVTGAKTRAGVLSIDETVQRGDAAGVAGHELRTLFEAAEDRGLSTGVVTTASISHATPGALYAHVPERGWEDDSRLSEGARAIDFPDIARQLVEFDHGDGLEVALGGGRSHFLPDQMPDPEDPGRRGARKDGRNLAAEWVGRHPRSRYVWDLEGFQTIDPEQTDHLLGLFATTHMSFESERANDVGGEPSLAEMTLRALEIVGRNPKGFVLVVEGGRIDHGHHLGNAYRALTETIAFSDAVRAAVDRVGLAQTLVVVTADHSHVLTLAGYPRRGNPILGKVQENDAQGEPTDHFTPDALGLPYTTLGYQNGPGYTGARVGRAEGPKEVGNGRVLGQQAITGGRPDLTEVDTTAPDYLQEAAVPLPSETHSGEDVPVYAGGPGAYLFHGAQEQNYIFHAIVEALGWNEPGGRTDGEDLAQER